MILYLREGGDQVDAVAAVYHVVIYRNLRP